MRRRKRERRTVRRIIKAGELTGLNNTPVKAEDSETILTKSLEENIKILKDKFKDDSTVIFRRFQNRFVPDLKCCIVFIEGMIDFKHINRQIIEPIMEQDLRNLSMSCDLLEEIKDKVLPVNDVEESGDLDRILQSICYGNTAFMLDGYDTVLLVESKGWEVRAITEPESGKVIRGPREGFTEHVISNISLIRRRIKNPNLKFRFMQLGKRTNTTVCITYIEGIAQESVLTELVRRLNSIDIDGILDSGYIQELISDAPFSTFPTVGYTERPDVVVARMLEGRIAVIVDGSPFVLTVPHVLVENIQVNEDYYDHFIFGSFNRFLRAVASIATISIPAVYLALVTYHQEMIPTQLLISLSASLEGVPLPTSLSLIIMLLVFDILREAGARMPTAVGQTVNIVGTLVLGQAAVEAHLVSAPVIIVTAISGITTLIVPTLIESLVLLRLFLLILASILGLYGYFIGIILIYLHLMSLRSFGVPYMLSVTRITDHDGQDAWIRAPWWSMTLRPKIIGAKNLVRQISNRNRG
ncbi:spore germination protein KA [Thermoclostridium stercorarium subsp. stercorarium DSM 8532]|uniref:Spore germination protein KA n=3 Tax=Thermoclostridium stercorarium TaxID=1510 RepID=L7VQ01_THES1|nr:spore germination protein [Thermoclostridium stercorarium]AGC67633.1 spore germination protein KA [Thermoclostridium stercorarium subsp. stercorarium DSM 8532]ANW99964.1 spore gernimation protein KA [Thermoclostridium stercorarium subsp. thermolacticum DSM 2910]ANX00597.1 spore gernimation protein KA [Thermoclostridium stercorarium subsp. leptospartum DSM 9219]UZQ86208.1 spore germination protein [Thermoclostridium stercorarium]